MKLFKSYNNKPDEQLMILVQRGDHRAFSLIYDRYAKRMKAFFYRMLWSDSIMAEDFVQDLFTKIIERPDLYQPDRPFAPWLFQIASNMCKNAYRKQQFEREYLNQLDQNNIQLPIEGQQIDEGILKNQLYQILDQLGEDKRQLFLLRYQQQLSIKELASIFDVTEGTVKSRLFYIRKALLQIMNEDKIIWENGK